MIMASPWGSLASRSCGLLRKLSPARYLTALSSRAVHFRASTTENLAPLTIDDVVSFMEGQAISVSSLTDSPATSAAIAIKCIIFTLKGGRPLLVVLDTADRVSESALAAYLGRPKSHLAMAPAQRLVEICGFPVGEVPPFGHRPHAIQTIVDQGVVAHSHIRFGPEGEYVIPAAELLRAAHAEVAAVSESSAASAAVSVSASAATRNNFETGEGGSSLSSASNALNEASGLPLPWSPGAQAVQLRGVIAQKRNIAKLLVFANLVPESVERVQTDTAAYLRRLWKHPDTGAACEVQLILGKTLERRLGRDAALQLFKSVKVGQVVELIGRPQAYVPQLNGGEERLTTLDVVIHDINIVTDVPHSAHHEQPLAESLPDSQPNINTSTKIPLATKKERMRQRVLDPSIPMYKHKVPPENIHVVSDLDGLRLMEQELLLPLSQPLSQEAEAPTLPSLVDVDYLLSEVPSPLPAAEDLAKPPEEDVASQQASQDGSLVGARNRRRQQRRSIAHTPTGWRPKLVIGLDAEWQPSSREEPNTPVSLLQISSSRHIFLLDMLALCAAGPPSDSGELVAEQRALSDLLIALLGHPDVAKVGFGLRYDLERVVESYPWLPCCGAAPHSTAAAAEVVVSVVSMADQELHDQVPHDQVSHEEKEISETSATLPLNSEISSETSAPNNNNNNHTVPIRCHIDAKVLARAAGDGHTSFKHKGLSALCRHVLGCELDKEQQQSDWASRPLTPEQIQYAAADACCLVDIFETLIESKPALLAPFWKDQFATNLTDICMLKTVQRQRNGTTGERSRQRSSSNGASVLPGASIPRYAGVTTRGSGGGSGGPTHQLECDIDALLKHLGSPVPNGGGRVAVVSQAIGGSREDGPRRQPHFPRGSGVLELSNAFLLFVNVPSGVYANKFSISSAQSGTAEGTTLQGTMQGTARQGTAAEEETCEISWWSSKGQTMSHPVMQRMLHLKNEEEHIEESTGIEVDIGNEQQPVDKELMNTEAADRSNTNSENAPAVLLFCRPMRDGYVCCGRLKPAAVSECEDGRLSVSWRLVDYPTLRNSEHFQRLLRLQDGAS